MFIYRSINSALFEFNIRHFFPVRNFVLTVHIEYRLTIIKRGFMDSIQLRTKYFVIQSDLKYNCIVLRNR